MQVLALRDGFEDRGAAIVEMALVAPIVGLLFVATIEAGWLLQANLTVEHVTREAIRELSVQATSDDGDWMALNAVDDSLGAIDPDDVQRIVFFDASGGDDVPNPSCRTGPPPGSSSHGCSVYLASDLGRPAAALTCGWCPDERSPGERVGVWVEVRYSSLTGLLDDRSLIDSSTMTIEG